MSDRQEEPKRTQLPLHNYYGAIFAIEENGANYLELGNYDCIRRVPISNDLHDAILSEIGAMEVLEGGYTYHGYWLEGKEWDEYEDGGEFAREVDKMQLGKRLTLGQG